MIVGINKPSYLLSVSVCILIFLMGFYIIFNSNELIKPSSLFYIYRFKATFFITGIFLLISSILPLIFITQRLLNNKPEIEIKEQGIFINSYYPILGLISWQDIKDIEIIDWHLKQPVKLLAVMLKNPEEQIEKETNKFKKMTLRANYKRYGTPMVISTLPLKIRFKELYKILSEKLREYKETGKVTFTEEEKRGYS